MSAFTLTSTAFDDGTTLPRRFTCDGVGNSPPLAWRGAPTSTAAFALVVTDPDAPSGAFTHWTLFDIPRELSAIPEGVPRAHVVLGGARQGMNDAHKLGWIGPYPPPGAPHRYVFELFALRDKLGLAAGASVADVRAALRFAGDAVARLTATYARPPR